MASSEETSYFKHEYTCPNFLLPRDDRLVIFHVGHYAVADGLLYPDVIARYAGIIWVVKGCVTIHTESKPLHAKSGMAVIAEPETRFSISCTGPCTEFRYLTICGKGCEELIPSARLWEGVFPYQNVPEKWLTLFADEIENAQRQSTLTGIAAGLFNLLRSEAECETKDKLVWEAESLLQNEWRNPDLNAKEVLNRLGVSRATLSTRFKKCTGESLLDYLSNIRYRHALRLLRSSSMNCAQIAKECGFTDQNYFSRWFATRNGQPPSSFGKRK